jgi:hypothetical protein
MTISVRMFAMRLAAAVLALSIIWAAPITAQSTPDSTVSDTSPVRHVILKRTATAFFAWFPGAFIGGAIGAATPHGPCGCDDPGLTQVLIGITVGGVVGSAFGAALPKLHSRCSFGRRFGQGLIGSVIGGAIGIIPITEGAQAITVPVFSIVGAAVAEAGC